MCPSALLPPLRPTLPPRALAELEDGGIELLIDILMKVEAVGFWPIITRLIFVVLLSKPAGGFRPICLLSALYRT